MTVYCVALAKNIDLEALGKYRDHAPTALNKHDGALVSSSLNLTKLEGADEQAEMAVILSFPTIEAAKAWRYEEDLAHVHDLRMKAANWSIHLLG